MDPNYVAAQGPTFFNIIMNLNPDGMYLSSPLLKLSNVMTSVAEAELGALFITAK